MSDSNTQKIARRASQIGEMLLREQHAEAFDKGRAEGWRLACEAIEQAMYRNFEQVVETNGNPMGIEATLGDAIRQLRDQGPPKEQAEVERLEGD